MEGNENNKRNKPELVAIDGRGRSDSLRVWESYRDQATLWRALTLLQMPAIALSITVALVLFFTSDTIINVPIKPEPGHYSADKLPDSEFVSVAVQVVNLLSTYTPYTARPQFVKARKYLWEPALSHFEKYYMKQELPTVTDMSRSQIFRVNMRGVKVQRRDDEFVVVRLPGTRQRLIGNRMLPPEQIAWYIKMITIPRNVHNEYGIVIIDVSVKESSVGEDGKPNATNKTTV